MVDYAPFYESLRGTQLEDWLDVLPRQVEAALAAHGNFAEWTDALAALPELVPDMVDFVNGVIVGSAENITPEIQHQLRQTLMRLHPWRKGPFSIYGLGLNTEWPLAPGV